jgi:hypothetical protein
MLEFRRIIRLVLWILAIDFGGYRQVVLDIPVELGYIVCKDVTVTCVADDVV